MVDDALTGVTEVVRGSDLLLSSPQQVYVARLLGFPEPRFCHLPLLCNRQGQRLSKRDRSMDMASLRQRFSPDDIIGRLAFLAGLLPQPQPMAAEALVPLFRWEQVPLSSIEIDDWG